MDRKEDIQPTHVLNGTLYAAATATSSIDMARFSQAVFFLSISAVATSTATFIVQDSGDGVTFTNTAYTFTQAAGVVNDTKFIFIREEDVRRYVRVRVAPGASGSVTLSACAIRIGATQPPPAVTYSIDTSAA